MTEKIRVLYAEDDLSDLDLTKTHFQLNTPDFELDVVDTGQRCLARLQEGKYDVLLLDNRLPDMDGIEVLKELTAKDVRMPVVMVTAVGDEALVVQVLRLEAWGYVPKQGNYVESLPAVLRDAVGEYRTQQGWGQGAVRRQRRILYVEHHQADIDLTLEHFADSAAHFILEVVHSPNHALALLQEDNFDLVLVDLRMPEMTAPDLLREAKHLGLLVPFIIITGRGDEAAAVAALKLGAFDYIIKRDNYLAHLPHAIENAIARSQLIQTNRRLQTELAERERAEAENARLLVEGLGQRQRLDEIIASVPGLVWEAWGRPEEADQKMNFVSNHVERMLGYSVQQWLSTPNFWLSIVHRMTRNVQCEKQLSFSPVARVESVSSAGLQRTDRSCGSRVTQQLFVTTKETLWEYGALQPTSLPAKKRNEAERNWKNNFDKRKKLTPSAGWQVEWHTTSTTS